MTNDIQDCEAAFMKMLDNINSTVRDDLQQSIRKGSKISIAAACFLIYACQELKKQPKRKFELVQKIHALRNEMEG